MRIQFYAVRNLQNLQLPWKSVAAFEYDVRDSLINKKQDMKNPALEQVMF